MAKAHAGMFPGSTIPSNVSPLNATKVLKNGSIRNKNSNVDAGNGIVYDFGQGFRPSSFQRNKTNKVTKTFHDINGKTRKVTYYNNFDNYIGFTAHTVSNENMTWDNPEYNNMITFADDALNSENAKPIEQIIEGTFYDDGGHIRKLRYAPTEQVLETTFRNEDVCVFFRVPSAIAGELIFLAKDNRTMIGKDGKQRHVLGIRFWDLVRIRGSKHGARYPFEYSSHGQQGYNRYDTRHFITIDTSKLADKLEKGEITQEEFHEKYDKLYDILRGLSATNKDIDASMLLNRPISLVLNEEDYASIADIADILVKDKQGFGAKGKEIRLSKLKEGKDGSTLDITGLIASRPDFGDVKISKDVAEQLMDAQSINEGSSISSTINAISNMHTPSKLENLYIDDATSMLKDALINMNLLNADNPDISKAALTKDEFNAFKYRYPALAESVLYNKGNPIIRTPNSKRELEQLVRSIGNAHNMLNGYDKDTHLPNSLKELFNVVNNGMNPVLSGKYTGVGYTPNEIKSIVNHIENPTLKKLCDYFVDSGDFDTVISLLKTNKFDRVHVKKNGEQVSYGKRAYIGQNDFLASHAYDNNAKNSEEDE